MTFVKKNIGFGFGRCNFHCPHCYGSSGSKCVQYELSTLIKIADKIGPFTNSINAGTGEPEYNDNYKQFCRYVRATYPEIKLSATTNGTSAVVSLIELGHLYHDIDFSMDKPSPSEHESMRGHAVAWNWVMKGLKHCQENGIEATVVSLISAETTDRDILGLLEIASRFKTNWRASWFRPAGRGKINEKELSLPPERVYEAWELITRYADIVSLADPLFDAVFKTGYSPDSGCACGVTSCRIQPNLSVTPCVFLKGEEWCGPSILEAGLEEIFNSENFCKFRARKPKFCLKCAYWDACRGGCASRAILYLGDLNEPDGFCPFVHGIPESQIEKIRKNISIKRKSDSLVHDGYLCVTIFKPKADFENLAGILTAEEIISIAKTGKI